MIRTLVVCAIICLSFISTVRAAESDRLYAQAIQALQQGDFEQAYQFAQRLATHSPNEISGKEALLIQGKALEQTDPVRALGSYRAYLSHNPFSVHRQEAQFKIAVIQDAIQHDELSGVRQYLRALWLRGLGRYGDAIAECKTLLSTYPQSRLADDALHLIAYIQLIDQNDCAEAIQTYRLFLSEFPKSSYYDQALYGAGLAYEGLKEFDRASASFTAIRDRHTQYALPFDLWRIPKDTYQSRVWFAKASNRLSEMADREAAQRNARQIYQTRPFAIGLGSQMKIDQPVGSGQSYRGIWHLTEASGLQLTHLTRWITRQTDWRWESKQTLLACTRAGYTPVIAFWYFGDDISPKFVKKNQEAYWQTIRQHLIPLIRDLPEVVVLLEPEFNKNGIAEWPGWDAVASRAITLIKQSVPGARVGLTFGDWGDYQYQDPTTLVQNAARLCDFIGFIEMTSAFDNQTNFDPSWSLSERIGRFADHLHKAFDKPLYLGYLAISTANNWEEKQAQLIQRFFIHLPYYMEQGVTGVAFFALFDDPQHQGWFASGERYFGLYTAEGLPKKGAYIWRQNVDKLRQFDLTPPHLKMPISGLPAEPVAFDHQQTVTGKAELSEWCRWNVKIVGQKSGATWQTWGAGTRVFFVWNGWADRGAFTEEPCDISLQAWDAAGNALPFIPPQKIDIHIPLQTALENIPLSVQAFQAWGSETRAWQDSSGTDGISMEMHSVQSGERIVFPKEKILNLATIIDRGCLKLTLTLQKAQEEDGLYIGLEDASGFRNELWMEAYTNRATDRDVQQTLRIPLSDFSHQGIRYNTQGQPEWRPFDFKAVSAITFTATAVPVTLHLYRIDIETTTR